ncbi:unnamed protein product [Heligmosomoides polygyrus]|uniref:Reverse transcriptase domain-containing protein n=1 Tax=Heligmosomoides polygyrus TaxID=6339 RepID=A0A183FVU0_HELPZ|nr:unnamed protein product [Heligmosomoides polygyrus]
MGVKLNCRQLHHLRFADDIVLITLSISQAERMLADFGRVRGNVGLQLNLTKTIYVYLGREVNTANDLAPELSRRKRAAWGDFKTVEEGVKKTKNVRLSGQLLDSTAPPALTYTSEWNHSDVRSDRLTQVKERLRSSELHRRSKI